MNKPIYIPNQSDKQTGIWYNGLDNKDNRDAKKIKISVN